ncbi:H-NS histone family protein [Methylobacter svalbardensis]|uniref:H-NS histone family protein n=1 Tax=Methylobacter svalbardensis TaxID=3080016 RepID=UPI0030EE5A3E
MTDLQNKTPEELQVIIAEAQALLEALHHSKHKAVIAQIKELAHSIGVTVDIHDDGKKTSKRAGASVPPKYRHPDNHSETWTGRGMTPKWLKSLIAEGRHKDDFLIND